MSEGMVGELKDEGFMNLFITRKRVLCLSLDEDIKFCVYACRAEVKAVK